MTSKAFANATDANRQQGGSRNKIINGSMTIDQRNGGAAVTVNTGGLFMAADRFRLSGVSSSGVFTGQQVTDAPNGFNNSLKVTVTTTDSSLGADDIYYCAQQIEGHNVSDLNFGGASAQKITLSFWVKSSLTGTFGGSFSNAAVNRSYPFNYTINAANTWEQKTVTVSGDTSGTWLKDNSIGLRVYWGLGIGSNFTGTANQWNDAFDISPSGVVNVMATNGATFYLTGVQLEVGDTATPFEHRSFGEELALCQRYYFEPVEAYIDWCGFKYGNTAYSNVPLPVTMRATPTVVDTTASVWYQGGTSYTYTPQSIFASASSVRMQGPTSGGLDGGAGSFYPNFTASAEL